jgi:putative transposase
MEKTRSDNELADRMMAVKLRLEKKPIEDICQVLGRTEVWFHKWWRRYQEEGPNGLYDQPRTYVHPSRTSPELERAIVNIRKRLASQQHPDTRYSLVGASSILSELAALHIRPLPSERTVERVLERNGITVPRVQLAPSLSKTTYPKPQVDDSNQLHQVDSVGPIYLKGKKQRYYVFTAKDVYDGSVFIKLYHSRQSDVILDFLGETWKHLGIPAQVQFDNAREVVGWGSAARYLSRVLRLCLRFGIEPILIPPAMPWWDGSVENFNGWFQPRIFQRRYTQVTPAAAGYCQQSTPSTEVGRLDLCSVSPPAQTPQAASLLHHPDRDRSHCRRTHYFYPPGDSLGHYPSAQSDLQGR